MQTNLLPVMVDVAGDDGEQAEQENDGSGVDDWMQRLDAWRQILHSAEVLHDEGDEEISTQL